MKESTKLNMREICLRINSALKVNREVAAMWEKAERHFQAGELIDGIMAIMVSSELSAACRAQLTEANVMIGRIAVNDPEIWSEVEAEVQTYYVCSNLSSTETESIRKVLHEHMQVCKSGAACSATQMMQAELTARDGRLS